MSAPSASAARGTPAPLSINEAEGLASHDHHLARSLCNKALVSVIGNKETVSQVLHQEDK